MTTIRHCGHCLKALEGREEGVLYCNKACRRNAQNKRAMDRKRGFALAAAQPKIKFAPPKMHEAPKVEPGPPKPGPPNVRHRTKRNLGTEITAIGRCPRPYKGVWRTEQEAEAEIERIGDPMMEVYRCSCGALHIGHPTRSQVRKRAMDEYKAWASEEA